MKLRNCMMQFRMLHIKDKLGEGENVVVQYPFHIFGIENIVVGKSVDIGLDALRSKLFIGCHFAGPMLTIVTGDHMPIVGKFLDEVTNEDKDVLDKMH